ncbi:hypothetical protein GCM10025768_23660 [Microbacterium pseudoresistens]|uniref:Glutaminase n=1 Tax=Microbacterium pseudoresistens TaxID=640634 RepID=A0A7Y9JM53_9MICO|nr:glutaminase [Microbacterium pseudoresistens]NYD53661.1 hypothetical protein [Microbacterium pseudoresistens]
MTAEPTSAALIAQARVALAEAPVEALGVEKTSRWRRPRIVRAGGAWHLGVLLIGSDAVFATGEVLRAAAEVRRGYAAESARQRAERRFAAARGGFGEGEVVHVGWTPIDLATVDAGGASGPLALVDGVSSVRWSASGAYMPLGAYLRERITLLTGEG